MNSAIPSESAYDVVCSADDREQWLAARQTGIGASDMPCILGLSSYESPYSLWARKTGRIAPEDTDAEAARWGLLLEPLVLAEYSRKSQRECVRHGSLLRSRVYPWALCTLDGIDSEGLPVEVKTCNEWLASEWTEGPPERYIVQAHQQMLVTGAAKCAIACLIGGQRLVWCDVERDDAIMRKIIFHGERFWDMVTSKEPPPVDGHERTRDALCRMHPCDAGTEVELPNELASIPDELDALKARRKQVDAGIKALENQLIEALHGAELGAFPSGGIVTYRATKRDAYTVAAAEFRTLRVKKAS